MTSVTEPRTDSLQRDLGPATSERETSNQTLTVLVPRNGWRSFQLGELWRYRELLFILAWRDVKVRYKQTLLGAAWAVLQPAMMMVVFTIFLGAKAHLPSGGWPYMLFVYAGLLPWTFFSTAVLSASNSVVGSSQLVTKVYFPRLAIPLAAVAAAVVDFLVAFGMLLVLLAWYGVWPGWAILLAPLALLLCAMAAAGFGSLLAALNVAYRDFKYTTAFLLQLWMFATPAIYMQTVDESPRAQAAIPSSSSTTRERPAGQDAADPVRSRGEGLIPDWIQAGLQLNPMVGLVQFFRATVLGGALPWGNLLTSFVVTLVSLVAGIGYFRRVEHGFADAI